MVNSTLIVRSTNAYVTAYGAELTRPLWTKRTSTRPHRLVAKDRLFVAEQAGGRRRLLAGPHMHGSSATGVVWPPGGWWLGAGAPPAPQNERHAVAA